MNWPLSLTPHLFESRRDSKDEHDTNSFLQRYFFNGLSIKELETYSLNGERSIARKSSYGLALLRAGMRKTQDGSRQYEILAGLRPRAYGSAIEWTEKSGWSSLSFFKREQSDILSRMKTSFNLGSRQVGRVVNFEVGGSSLVSTGVGKALSYDFRQEDVWEALWRFRNRGVEDATGFLKWKYPHIDEELVAKGLAAPVYGMKFFVSELILISGLSLILDQVLPSSSIKHAVEAGTAYALSNILREAFTKTTAWKVAGSVAEGLPVAATQIGVSLILDELSDAVHVKKDFTGRWFVENTGTVLTYQGLKSALRWALANPAIESLAAETGALELAGGFASVSTGSIAAVVGAALLAGTIVYASNQWTDQDYIQNTQSHELLTGLLIQNTEFLECLNYQNLPRLWGGRKINFNPLDSNTWDGPFFHSEPQPKTLAPFVPTKYLHSQKPMLDLGKISY